MIPTRCDIIIIGNGHQLIKIPTILDAFLFATWTSDDLKLYNIGKLADEQTSADVMLGFDKRSDMVRYKVGHQSTQGRTQINTRSGHQSTQGRTQVNTRSELADSSSDAVVGHGRQSVLVPGRWHAETHSLLLPGARSQISRGMHLAAHIMT